MCDAIYGAGGAGEPGEEPAKEQGFRKQTAGRQLPHEPHAPDCASQQAAELRRLPFERARRTRRTRLFDRSCGSRASVRFKRRPLSKPSVRHTSHRSTTCCGSKQLIVEATLPLATAPRRPSPPQFLHAQCASVRARSARGAAEVLLWPQAVWPRLPSSPSRCAPPARLHHTCHTTRGLLTRAAIGCAGAQARGPEHTAAIAH